MLSSDVKKWILYGVLGGSLLFNIVNLFSSETSEETVAELDQSATQELDDVVASQLESTPALENGNLSSEWKTIRTEVSHSLSRTFAKTGTDDADALSMVYSRLFVWDVNLTKDLYKGDKVDVVYRIGEDGFPDIAAARLHSKKLDKTLTAFKWKAPQDEYASYWAYDGTEAAYRLKHSPIEQYEQITSLLKDGRGHKGMDFKTPVGTPSVSPKSGLVTRVNFGNFKYNGNCVEVEFADGTLAKWLHMEKISVKAGQRVSKGTQVGLTGNTGRSMGPHLHYQLDRGRRNLDPVKYHGTYRRKLNSSDIPEFLRDIGPYINALDNDFVAEL